MSTDVKYKESHDVENCRLYTASNYYLGMYVSVPDSDRAIYSRTITYNFRHIINKYIKITPSAWLLFWNQHDQGPDLDIDNNRDSLMCFEDLVNYVCWVEKYVYI